MDALLNDIINYVKLLKYNYNLQASFDFSMSSVKHSDHLLPYIKHDNAYCSCIKKCHFEKCMQSRRMVIKKQPLSPFFGKCYAGVEEYVFPVKIGGKIVNFISVSGYRSRDAETPRFELYADNGKTDIETLEKAYNSLDVDIPKLSDISTIIMPLVHMVQLYMMMLEKSKALLENDEFPPAYNMALRYIAENYDNNISITDIAERCNCSVSHLSHIFKKCGNVTITQYLIRLKMIKASDLLIYTSANITQIAIELGYNDANYFTLQFKKYYGISPKEYRNNKKNEIDG